MYKRILVAGMIFMVVSLVFTFTYKDMILRDMVFQKGLSFPKGMNAKTDDKNMAQIPVISDTKTTQDQLDHEFYTLDDLDEYTKEFTNHVDGYSLSIPADFQVDMRNNAVRALFFNDKVQMEIYKEELKNNVSSESYISYSNQFKDNSTFHHVEREQWIEIQGYRTYTLQWSRKKSTKIENDKNYYASFDLIYDSKTVFTFLLKSQESLTEKELGIIHTFQPRAFTKVGKTLSEAGEATSIREKALTTQLVYGKYFGDDSRLVWGIFEPNTPENFQNIKDIESYIQYQFPFIVTYQHFNLDETKVDLDSVLSQAIREGRIVELSLQTNAIDQVYDILDGKYDDYIEAYATAIKNAGVPVLMRLCNEMNGDWCTYCALHYSKDTTLFQEMYRYIYGKFVVMGANAYTLWVFNPNERSFPDFKWNHSTLYYPGNEYVDLIGLTGYNTGTYYHGESWRSFDEIYKPIYKMATEVYDKPLMITEFASSSVGGDKESWIKDMFKSIETYDKIKVAIWWSGRDLDGEGNVARPYWLNENQEILDIFRENLSEE